MDNKGGRGLIANFVKELPKERAVRWLTRYLKTISHGNRGDVGQKSETEKKDRKTQIQVFDFDMSRGLAVKAAVTSAITESLASMKSE